MAEKRRVAVLGATGIGKHHARWWDLEGADVCAILGSTPESAQSTAGKLHEMFGFTGKAYSSLDTLLSEAQPDIVDICTPPSLHSTHALQTLTAGCDVLCEKPLVFDDALSDEENIRNARTVVAHAEQCGHTLAMCTQYAIAAEECRDLLVEHGEDEEIFVYHGTLISPTRGRPPRPAHTWVDLAPHMLGILQVLCPEGAIDWDTVDVAVDGHQAETTFAWDRGEEMPIQAQITTNHRDEEPANVRQIAINGTTFDILGQNDENGIFCAKYVTPFGEFLREDTMRLTIRRFLQGKPAFTADMALENLIMMVRLRASML